MDGPTLWNQSLHLVSQFYFERKEAFEVNFDTYPVWVLFALESGKFDYRIGSETGSVGSGEMIFCPPNCRFERKMIAPLRLHYIHFELAGGLQPELADQMPSLKSHPTDGKRLASNFAYLRKLNLAIDQRSAIRKQSILSDMWLMACEEWEAEPQQEGVSGLIDSNDELMNQAAEWLNRKALTRFGMSELSRMLGLSPVQLTRRFHKAFRMSPSEFVRTLRIKRAAQLLIDSDLTLDQIADKCGYDNGFYLSRVFSQYMNLSPSKYRERNRV
jgi:AraC family transcriptional regulator